jgi:hypothetical protein
LRIPLNPRREIAASHELESAERKRSSEPSIAEERTSKSPDQRILEVELRSGGGNTCPGRLPRRR